MKRRSFRNPVINREEQAEVTITCVECQKDFQARSRTAMFCSDACWKIHNQPHYFFRNMKDEVITEVRAQTWKEAEAKLRSTRPKSYNMYVRHVMYEHSVMNPKSSALPNFFPKHGKSRQTEWRNCKVCDKPIYGSLDICSLVCHRAALLKLDNEKPLVIHENGHRYIAKEDFWVSTEELRVAARTGKVVLLDPTILMTQALLSAGWVRSDGYERLT